MDPTVSGTLSVADCTCVGLPSNPIIGPGIGVSGLVSTVDTASRSSKGLSSDPSAN